MTSRGPLELKFFYYYKYTYNISEDSDSSQATVSFHPDGYETMINSSLN